MVRRRNGGYRLACRLPNKAFSLPDPKTSVRLRCCHNCDVLRTQGERPRIASACDNSARPDPCDSHQHHRQRHAPHVARALSSITARSRRTSLVHHERTGSIAPHSVAAHRNAPGNALRCLPAINRAGASSVPSETSNDWPSPQFHPPCAVRAGCSRRQRRLGVFRSRTDRSWRCSWRSPFWSCWPWLFLVRRHWVSAPRHPLSSHRALTPRPRPTRRTDRPHHHHRRLDLDLDRVSPGQAAGDPGTGNGRDRRSPRRTGGLAANFRATWPMLK
jgi:hypothetical protein